jgi:hypothetical protein
MYIYYRFTFVSKDECPNLSFFDCKQSVLDFEFFQKKKGNQN